MNAKKKQKIESNERHDKKNQATWDDSNVKIQFQNRSQSSLQNSAHKVVQSGTLECDFCENTTDSGE